MFEIIKNYIYNFQCRPKTMLCNKNGTSPFYITCKNLLGRTINLSLNGMVDVNLYTKQGYSPLYAACTAHKLVILLKLLLDGYSDIILSSQQGHNSF